MKVLQAVVLTACLAAAATQAAAQPGAEPTPTPATAQPTGAQTPAGPSGDPTVVPAGYPAADPAAAPQPYGQPLAPYPQAAVSAEPKVVKRPNKMLVGTGLVLGGLSYGVTAGYAGIYGILVWPIKSALTDDNSFSPTAAWMFVPVLGPVMAARTDFVEDDNPNLKPWFYADAAIQGVGLAMLVAGFVFKSEEVVQSGPIVTLGPQGSAGMTLTWSLD